MTEKTYTVFMWFTIVFGGVLGYWYLTYWLPDVVAVIAGALWGWLAYTMVRKNEKPKRKSTTRNSYRPPQKKEEKNYSWIWYVLALVVGIWLCGGGISDGPLYPFDNSPAENLEMQQDMSDEGDYPRYLNEPSEAERNKYDYEETMMALDGIYANPDEHTTNNCPYGCTQRSPGCDIKGNIGYESGEKIYHLPGGDFYSNTTISPDYGERWFCTEAEAEANGWRKSYK